MSNICILTLTFGGSVQSRSTASFSYSQPGSASSTHLPFDVTGKSFSALEAGIGAGSRAWISFSASLSFFSPVAFSYLSCVFSLFGHHTVLISRRRA